MLKEIISLRQAKTSADTDIPTNIIKENASTFSDFLLSGFNHLIRNSTFP